MNLKPEHKETAEQKKDEKDCSKEQKKVESEKFVPEKNFLELKDSLQRLQAEFENYRKREEEQKKKFLEYANASLLEKFLPVTDSMEKAEEHAKEKKGENSDSKGLSEIISMKKQFAMIMKNSGVEEIPTLGKQFDPGVHDCIAFEKNPSREDGIVLEELLKGYKFKGMLLRPSKVKVNKLEHCGAKK